MVDSGLNRRPVARYLLAVTLALQIMVIGLLFGWGHAARRSDRERGAASRDQGTGWSENLAKAISHPRVVDAKESELRDDESVVGLVVGGKPRAYRLGAFRHPSGHVVNDLIGEVPVSVVFCDLSDCLRVYTDPQGSTPLGIEVAGRNGSDMIVRLNGVLYDHASGLSVAPEEGRIAFPYTKLAPTRTTWKEWVRRHPDTDVYEGDRRRSLDATSARDRP